MSQILRDAKFWARNAASSRAAAGLCAPPRETSGCDWSFSRLPGQTVFEMPEAIALSVIREPRVTRTRAAAIAFSAFCTWKWPGKDGEISSDQPEEISTVVAVLVPVAKLSELVCCALRGFS